MSAHHCFEDRLWGTDISDVLAEQAQALAKQRQMIALVRAEERAEPEWLNGWTGERIKAFRRSLGASQRTLGRMLGVSESTVNNWESAFTRPGPENVGRLESLTQAIAESPGEPS